MSTLGTTTVPDQSHMRAEGTSTGETDAVRFVPVPRVPDDRRTPDPQQAPDRGVLPLLLAVPRAARLLGISRSAAYRLAETGELPVRRLGGRIYVVTAGLLDLVEAK